VIDRSQQVQPEATPNDACAERPLRVLLADDHEMMRLALRTALASLGPSTEWFEAGRADEAQALLEKLPDLDLALIDFNMPGASGVQWLAQLRIRYPSLPLVVISAQEDSALIRQLIALGVAGFIPKSDSARVVLQAVTLVLAGGTYAPLRLLNSSTPDSPRNGGRMSELTPRQLEVLQRLARGLPNKLIARELTLSEGTVKAHLLAIYRALNARNRTEAVVAAQDWLRDAQR
jgi:DNA-binding NarL/FixJ family response regulator